mmetsp:Transcript_11551/g.20481  ORF Transcript_11551/g.20481 Transcript_11551/m.20481 type:complete len:115 (-) Transcript_11551:176-520(-)
MRPPAPPPLLRNAEPSCILLYLLAYLPPSPVAAALAVVLALLLSRSAPRREGVERVERMAVTDYLFTPLPSWTFSPVGLFVRVFLPSFFLSFFLSLSFVLFYSVCFSLLPPYNG